MVKANKKSISQEEVKSLLDYDPDTGEFTWKPRSCAGFNRAGKPVGYTFKCSGGKEYITIRLNTVSYLAHRLAFVYMEGYMPDEVDHDDGDGTNNKWVNLNDSNHLGNMKNLKRRHDNTSGCPGVVFLPKTGRWEVRINHKKIRHHLGTFDTKEEAISVRKKAEKSANFHKNHGSVRPL